MADDPKQSQAAPPFAYKGAARPLARSRPGDSEAAGVREERRPSGLHTRPDLFGSSAVMARPADPAVEESDGGETPESPETAPHESTDARPEEADTAAPGAAQPAAPAPAANLLDHPVRIPDSIAFEDWPDGSDFETEDGARSAQVAAPEAAEPVSPEAPEPPRAGEHREPLAAPSGPAYAPPPAPEPEEPGGRLGALLAQIDKEAITERLREQRWPLALGAVACAALLVAGLVGGIVPLGGDDRETAQLAEGPDAPATGHDLTASQDLAGPSESESRDLTMAPAGNTFGPDPQMKSLPEGPDSAPAGARDEASQLAALPEPQGPGALERGREPIVDFMRIDPDGKAVVAGRAAPGTELIVLDNGEPLGAITADIYGLWTFVSQNPLANGRHEIGLRVKRQGSEISDPAIVTDSGSDAPLAPDLMTGEQELVADQSSPTDLPAPEQLAAATPEAPVQTDQSLPISGADAMTPAAEETLETAAAAPAVTDAAQPAEEESGAAAPASAQRAETQPDGTQPAEAEPSTGEATSAAAAPAPKPEAPEPVQTAAVPADGDFVIQLASFKDPDTAAREQASVEEGFSDLLAGHEVFVQKADLGEQGIFYRVRLGPFASLADARATCSRFQARDRDCLAMAR